MCRSLLLIAVCIPMLATTFPGAVAQDVSAKDDSPPWVNFVPSALMHPVFSYDGTFLAGTTPQEATVWDLAKDERVFSLPEVKKEIYTSFAFSRDGKLLAMATKGKLLLYDTQTWKLKSTLPTQDYCRNARFTPDDKHILVVTGEVSVLAGFNVATKKQVSWFKGSACTDYTLLGDT